MFNIKIEKNKYDKSSYFCARLKLRTNTVNLNIFDSSGRGGSFTNLPEQLLLQHEGVLQRISQNKNIPFLAVS